MARTSSPLPILLVLGLALVGCAAMPTAEPSTPTIVTPSGVEGSIDPTSYGPMNSATKARIGGLVEMSVAASDRYQRLLRGFVVSVNGDIVIERYAPGIEPTATTNVFSVTKSVVSTLIGIAIDEGAIPGVEATLGELLPDEAPAMPEAVRAVTLRQVLTMTGGFGASDSFLSSDNWVRSILTDAANRPDGDDFLYSNGSSHLLSAILVEATGRPVLDYARDKLFDPLAISTRPDTELTVAPGPAGDFAGSIATYDGVAGFIWPVDPTGLAIAFSDLKITVRDMLSIGQLYLDGGRKDGRQVVPAEWVTAATTEQVRYRGGFGDGYGYQWWVGTVDGHATYAAVGSGGQLIQVVPDLGLVAAACSEPNSLDATSISTDLVHPIVTMLG